MWIKQLLLGGVGLTSGFAVAGGSFALIVALSVVPRIIGKSSTALEILRYENAMMAGGILGNIAVIFPQIRLPFGKPLLLVYGLCSGIYVGCLVMALSEIMNVFPVIFRRIRLKSGLFFVITCMAAGKVAGGLWYFFKGMGG